MEPIGRKHWAIVEGHIPSQSSFSHRALICHETACILNAGDRDAHVRVTVFFVGREPIGPYNVTVTARCTLHLPFKDLKDPAPIPCDTDLRRGVRIRCPDRAATHAARFKSRRVKPAFNNGLCTDVPDGSGRNTKNLGESIRICCGFPRNRASVARQGHYRNQSLRKGVVGTAKREEVST
jgi:hypothetical protein